MNIAIDGVLGWLVGACIGVTAAAIVLLGTWNLLNWFIWQILVQTALRWLRLYVIFIHFCKYRHRYYKWAKKYEGKYEEGVNED